MHGHHVNIRDSDEVDCAVFTTFELHSASTLLHIRKQERVDVKAN